MEARVLLSGNPTYYTVNLTSDTGASSGTDVTTGDLSGDLLWAITQANANTNTAGSVINFDPTVFGTPQTIALTSTLELSESDGPEMIQGPGSSLLTITGGNAVGVFLVESGVTASISGLTISDGSAYNGGGIDNSGNLTVSSSSFTGDTAANNGGGIWNGGVANLTGDTVSGSTAGNGGGVFNQGTLSLSGSTISGNTANATAYPYSGFGGGGIFNAGSLTITTSTFTGNTATADSGAGIWNGGALTLTDSTLSGNVRVGGQPAAGGGGLFNASGTAVIEDCTVAGNSSGWGGGGLFQYRGTTTVVNSTIADNQSPGGGGIISLSPGLTLVNSTVAYNVGGGIFATGVVAYATVTLNNTIVVENDDDLSQYNGGSFTGADNLVGNDQTGTLSANDNLLGVTDPGIGLLANNGGPTQTIALLAGSPAIDAGSNALAVDPTTGDPLTYDQRGPGYPRFVNGIVDIGAFESSGFTITVTSGSGQSTDVSTAFSAPLIVTVTANNPVEPVAGARPHSPHRPAAPRPR